MKIYRPRIPLVAVAILGLGIVGLGAGVIWQHAARSALSRQIREQRQLLSSTRRELRNCVKWRRDYTDLSLKLGGRLPECTWSDQMPFIVSQLTGIVESHGVKIQTLRPEPMTAASGILRFPLGIEIQTGLRELTQILEDIENTVPLLEIERLDIRAAQDKPDKLQVGMTVASFVVLDKRAPLTKRRALPNVEKPAAAQETPADESVEKAPAAHAAKPSTSARTDRSPSRKSESHGGPR
ncbi:MAG TPA: type 4a pilus biogenesis protein PilO [Armatimonadota bacterium]|nr:type 4a pilus biogenesis protein PilO [Armatimonadota bacterium]